MTTAGALYTLLILALFALAFGLWAFRNARSAVATPSQPSAEGSQIAAGPLADISAQVLELRNALKAHVRDFEDFEEKVRRWQGRVNRQEGRDAANAADPEAGDDPAQISLLGPTAASAASAAQGRRGQRFTRSQLASRR